MREHVVIAARTAPMTAVAFGCGCVVVSSLSGEGLKRLRAAAGLRDCLGHQVAEAMLTGLKKEALWSR